MFGYFNGFQCIFFLSYRKDIFAFNFDAPLSIGVNIPNTFHFISLDILYLSTCHATIVSKVCFIAL